MYSSVMPVLGKPRWAGGQVPRVALRPAASPGTRRADAVHQAPRAGQQRRAGPRCQHSFGDARAKHTVPTWRSAQSGPLAWTAGGGLRRGAWEPGRTWTIAAWRRPAPPASLLASLWASASTVGSAARSRSWKAGCERAAGRQVTRWLLRYKDESRVKRKRVTTPRLRDTSCLRRLPSLPACRVVLASRQVFKHNFLDGLGGQQALRAKGGLVLGSGHKHNGRQALNLCACACACVQARQHSCPGVDRADGPPPDHRPDVQESPTTRACSCDARSCSSSVSTLMMRTLGVCGGGCAREQVRVAALPAKSIKLVACHRPTTHLSPRSTATCSSSLASIRHGPHLGGGNRRAHGQGGATQEVGSQRWCHAQSGVVVAHQVAKKSMMRGRSRSAMICSSWVCGQKGQRQATCG